MDLKKVFQVTKGVFGVIGVIAVLVFIFFIGGGCNIVGCHWVASWVEWSASSKKRYKWKSLKFTNVMATQK